MTCHLTIIIRNWKHSVMHFCLMVSGAIISIWHVSCLLKQHTYWSNFYSKKIQMVWRQIMWDRFLAIVWPLRTKVLRCNGSLSKIQIPGPHVRAFWVDLWWVLGICIFQSIQIILTCQVWDASPEKEELCFGRGDKRPLLLVSHLWGVKLCKNS